MRALRLGIRKAGINVVAGSACAIRQSFFLPQLHRSLRRIQSLHRANRLQPPALGLAHANDLATSAGTPRGTSTPRRLGSADWESCED